jgi:DNA-binding response OmpR family regulator
VRIPARNTDADSCGNIVARPSCEIRVLSRDRQIVSLVRAILANEAIRLVPATSLPELLSSRSDLASVDAVIMDLPLEGADGDVSGIVESLRRKFPWIRLLLIFGHSGDEIPRTEALERKVWSLRKPFRPCDLTSIVRDVIAAPLLAEP